MIELEPSNNTLPLTVDRRYFQFYPLDMMLNPHLSHGAKLLWGVMFFEHRAFLTNPKSADYFNVCCYYKTNKQLAALIPDKSRVVTDRTISRYTGELQQFGYLLCFRNYNNANYWIPIHPLDGWYHKIIAAYLTVKSKRDITAGRIDVTNKATEKEINPTIKAIDDFIGFKAWCAETLNDANVLIDIEKQMAYFPDDNYQYITDEEHNHSLDEYGLMIVDHDEWQKRHIAAPFVLDG